MSLLRHSSKRTKSDNSSSNFTTLQQIRVIFAEVLLLKYHLKCWEAFTLVMRQLEIKSQFTWPDRGEWVSVMTSIIFYSESSWACLSGRWNEDDVPLITLIELFQDISFVFVCSSRQWVDWVIGFLVDVFSVFDYLMKRRICHRLHRISSTLGSILKWKSESTGKWHVWVLSLVLRPGHFLEVSSKA
jgi:hypothetical protein